MDKKKYHGLAGMRDQRFDCVYYIKKREKK